MKKVISSVVLAAALAAAPGCGDKKAQAPEKIEPPKGRPNIGREPGGDANPPAPNTPKNGPPAKAGSKVDL